MEGLAEIAPILDLGVSGILLVATGWIARYVIRIVTQGDFVPRTTVDVLLQARDAEIQRANHRGDEWHKAFDGERLVSELLREQNRELIEVARTVEHVMEALAQVAEGQADGGR